ncbi:MAG: MBL fold metallo-hydrolase [Accumulibacter sp.]|jgi:hypothetical protein|uniref:ComEC/Rec2 family competence protein n=1 Tax=Accumulibacter sp. TaxID=2053492 RepID=UPI002FC3949C
MYRIDLLPAEYGDAIWLEYGQGRRISRLLIDCGTAAVYPRIRERILALPEGQRHFELLLVTHVDLDHIGGALALLRDSASLGVSFGEIWFNGYMHLSPGGVVPAAADDTLGPLQGEELSDLIVAHGRQRWNAAVHGGALLVPKTGPLPQLSLPSGMRLTLLSPYQEQLDALRPAWEAACRKAGIVPGVATADDASRLEEDDAAPEEDDLLGDPDPEQLAARPYKADRARPNGSSIALLAEYGGRRALLTGDAFAEVLLASLARLPGNGGGRLAVDACKLSHHGSRGNTSSELVRALHCRDWLVSSNGKQFRHPDGEAIARVLRDGGGDVRLHFNYRSEFNEMWSSTALQRRYRYAATYPASEAGGVRLDLSRRRVR